VDAVNEDFDFAIRKAVLRSVPAKGVRGAGLEPGFGTADDGLQSRVQVYDKSFVHHPIHDDAGRVEGAGGFTSDGARFGL